LFILGKFAWKPMLDGLAKREQSIAAAVEEAQRLRAESEKLRAEMSAERQKANDAARELIEEARRDAQALKDEMVNSAKHEIQTERDRLHRELTIAKDQALQQLWERSAELATLISSKTIRRQISLDDHRALVDEALAELQHAADVRRNFVRGHHG
jgi:F-type H+-transporting ATPase subunit b